MGKIDRNPEQSQKHDYDLIVVGGGIYGAMICLEACRRHLRPLLVERDDFGSHTSFNSLRIIHGGLRYLQKADLHRFRESVRERHWFLKTFPHNVSPLPCLMPLYGTGLHRPEILLPALLINDWLGRFFVKQDNNKSYLPSGRMIGPGETRRIFPAVDSRGLRGAAIWHDALMANSQRLLMDTLVWACDNGADALNYVEAISLKTDARGVRGITAMDRITHQSYTFSSRVVINAAGPWSAEMARKFHQPRPDLFRPSLAYNIMFHRPPLSSHALAVTPRRPGARTYFIVPFNGNLCVGTGHETWPAEPGPAKVSQTQLRLMIDEMNLTIPGLNLNLDEVAFVFKGLLPVKTQYTTTLSTREIILDHSEINGPKGLYSVSGVKFTTSRKVGEKLLNRIFPPHRYPSIEDRQIQPDRYPQFSKPAPDLAMLKYLIENEAVVHPDDLIYRRTNLWQDPKQLQVLLPAIRKLI